jgi:hypothetical protein
VTRKTRVEQIMGNTGAVLVNMWELPTEEPERYLVVEESQGNIIWGSIVATLEDCKRYILDSDTERDKVYVYDLDKPSDRRLSPIYSIRGWHTVKD